MNKMGSRIKQKRQEKGLTCEALGKILNVQKSAISKWERGAVENISQTKIMEMAKIFGCSPSWLMGYDEDPPQREKVCFVKYLPGGEKICIEVKDDDARAELEHIFNLYESYQGAIPQVREAVEALLKPSRSVS